LNLFLGQSFIEKSFGDRLMIVCSWPGIGVGVLNELGEPFSWQGPDISRCVMCYERAAKRTVLNHAESVARNKSFPVAYYHMVHLPFLIKSGFLFCLRKGSKALTIHSRKKHIAAKKINTHA